MIFFCGLALLDPAIFLYFFKRGGPQKSISSVKRGLEDKLRENTLQAYSYTRKELVCTRSFERGPAVGTLLSGVMFKQTDVRILR